MRIGIMQPYLFPYIGYFQLISIVDKFVIHEDIQYIKGGWINRNRILFNKKPRYIVLPISKDSSKLNINKRCFTPEFEINKKKILRQIEAAYGKAPYFKAVYNLIEKCFQCSNRNVSHFITNCLKECCNYLKIETEFVISSNLNLNNQLKGQERVIEITKLLGATRYLNPPGGIELYNKDEFERNNIKLNFLRCHNISYHQFNNNYIPKLSVIDVMMFNDNENINNFMNQFEIV